MAGFVGPSTFNIASEQPVQEQSRLAGVASVAKGVSSMFSSSSGGSDSLDQRFATAWKDMYSDLSPGDASLGQLHQFSKRHPGMANYANTQAEAMRNPQLEEFDTNVEIQKNLRTNWQQSATGSLAIYEASLLEPEERDSYLSISYGRWLEDNAAVERSKQEAAITENADRKRELGWEGAALDTKSEVDMASRMLPEILEAIQLDPTGFDTQASGLKALFPNMPDRITANNLPFFLEAVESTLFDRFQTRAAGVSGLSLVDQGIQAPEDVRKQVFDAWTEVADLAKIGVSASKINELRVEKVRVSLREAGIPVEFWEYMDTKGMQSDIVSLMTEGNLSVRLVEFVNNVEGGQASLDAARAAWDAASKEETRQGYEAAMKLVVQIGYQGYLPEVDDAIAATDYRDKASLALSAHDQRESDEGVTARISPEQYSSLFGGANASRFNNAAQLDPNWADEMVLVLSNDFEKDMGQVRSVASQFGIEVSINQQTGNLEYDVTNLDLGRETVIGRSLSQVEAARTRGTETRLDAPLDPSLSGEIEIADQQLLDRFDNMSESDVMIAFFEKLEGTRPTTTVDGITIPDESAPSTDEILKKKWNMLNNLGDTGKRVRNTILGVTPQDTRFAQEAVGALGEADTSDSLLGAIASGEGGYNSSNQGTSGGRIVGSTSSTTINGKQLENATLGEIMDLQRKGELFAVGAFQFIPETLAEVVRKMNLGMDMVFSRELQDDMARHLIFGGRRRVLAGYLRGEHDDIKGAALDLAKEWASFPNPDTGNSYYGSGNKASHSVEETYRILRDFRGNN